MLCYNTRDMRFCCYLSTSSHVVELTLYHKPAKAKSITDREEPGIYLGGRNTRSYLPGEDQLVRSYLGDQLRYALVNPLKREQISVEGYREGILPGEVVEINILWKEGWNVLLAKEYGFVLKKEENGKVWLGDEEGRGVIIKK